MPSRNEFWRYSLKVYGIPGVAEACLRLQDECDADVNLVLYCLWHAAEGRELAPSDVAAAVTAVEQWQEQVVRPLREVRRWLKGSGLGSAPNQPFRENVKALELEAERLQQEHLESLPVQEHARVKDIETAARNALQNYAGLLSRVFPEEAVKTIAAASARTA